MQEKKENTHCIKLEFNNYGICLHNDRKENSLKKNIGKNKVIVNKLEVDQNERPRKPKYHRIENISGKKRSI